MPELTKPSQGPDPVPSPGSAGSSVVPDGPVEPVVFTAKTAASVVPVAGPAAASDTPAHPHTYRTGVCTFPGCDRDEPVWLSGGLAEIQKSKVTTAPSGSAWARLPMHIKALILLVAPTFAALVPTFVALVASHFPGRFG